MVCSKGMRFRSIARNIKKLYYIVLGLFGDMLFFLMRILRIISKPKPFLSENIKRILVIRLDRIGDVALTTPALRALRESFTHAKIYLLTRSYAKDLVVGNTDIDELLIFDDKTSFFIEIMKKAKVLKGKKFDLAIVLNPNFWSNFLSFAGGAIHRVGYDVAGSGFFLTKKIQDRRAQYPRHEVEVNLEVVGSIGAHTNDKSLVISISKEGESFAQDFLKNNNISYGDALVAIHAGGFYHYTRWPAENFAKVCDYLIERYNAKPILVGSASERFLSEKIVSLMKNPPIVAVGNTNLTGLISLTKRCKLFIGNSSGPMHIAAALRIPVVGIFGNISPVDSFKNWGPWGEGHVIVSKNLDCTNCQPADCLSLDCMQLITVEDVLKAVEEQLGK
ncbi:MAG: glycosyltransferase family 9 protein [Candidatus Omnitrophica bacterium]|nr:glycosyltransferase family 9 protein [Candidatus Omnitrophota bacterium]